MGVSQQFILRDARPQAHPVKSRLSSPRQSRTPPPSRQQTPKRVVKTSPAPATSRKATSRNTRRSTPTTVEHVRDAVDGKPTVNWQCVSHVVSDQNVESTYSKPKRSSPSSSEITSYGKLVTKTVTITVTTTIATTEILEPGEPGYSESLRKQQQQQQQQQQQAEAGAAERDDLNQRYERSLKEAQGECREAHEAFHTAHHRSARPALLTANSL